MDQKRNKILKSQKGFTLIEIIAVLVILGILAAVAVPKFNNLTSQAQAKANEGALAAAFSNAVLSYSSYILENSAEPTGISATYQWTGGGTAQAIETDLGDYTATYAYTAASGSTAASVSVVVTAKSGGTTATESFNLP